MSWGLLGVVAACLAAIIILFCLFSAVFEFMSLLGRGVYHYLVRRLRRRIRDHRAARRR